MLLILKSPHRLWQVHVKIKVDTYREFSSTILQEGLDGEFRLSRGDCPAFTPFAHRARAQAQMSGVHLEARVKHVRLHHDAHRVGVAVDHDGARRRMGRRALLRLARSRLRLVVTNPARGERSRCGAGASAGRQPAFCERGNWEKHRKPQRGEVAVHCWPRTGMAAVVRRPVKMPPQLCAVYQPSTHLAAGVTDYKPVLTAHVCC